MDRGELLRALAHLAEPPGAAHIALAGALGLPAPPDAAGYTDLFEFQLYPYASVHLGSEGMLGGEAEGRVAGFWSAVGREVPSEPDHLSSLIGLYVALGEEGEELAGETTGAHGTDADAHPSAREPSGSAVGVAAGPDAEAALVARSRRALLEEHLTPWIFAFLERVEELGGAFHAAWAKMLGEALGAEVDRHGPASSLPAHLQVVDELPDPRLDGAKPFLAALLAPARSGAILTRADLGRIAHELGLGLRAGERRYALEHLMGQNATAVLEALADEMGRQAAAHEARVARLGRAAAFFAQRAGSGRALLRTLADEAEKSEAAWAAEESPAPGESAGPPAGRTERERRGPGSATRGSRGS